MHSIFGLVSASIVRFPSFQQVVRHGVSLHIICISVPPSSLGIGYVYFLNWSSVGQICAELPYQLMGSLLRIALWTSVFGIICGGGGKNHPYMDPRLAGRSSGITMALGKPLQSLCWWTPGFPNPCIASNTISNLAGSVEYGPRIYEPP